MAAETALLAGAPSIADLYLSLEPPSGPGPRELYWLLNFEAEQFWSDAPRVRFPSLSRAADDAIRNRLEEVALLVTGARDTVILRAPSDPAYLDYLSGLGLSRPTILTVSAGDRASAISLALLNDGSACAELAGRARAGSQAYLLPYATTRLEEEIAARTGLRLLGPSAAVASAVNSKIYSRRLSRELGLRTVPGCECDCWDDLERALETCAGPTPEGSKLVIKDPLGVSGKGLLVVDGRRKAQALLPTLRRLNPAAAECRFVVERWIPKERDINGLIFIGRRGDVRLLAVKEAITSQGVHLGHHWPARLTERQSEYFEESAIKVGQGLFRSGYTGMAGLDAIVDLDGEIYPVLEINARMNMSTFHLAIENLLDPGMQVTAKHYPVLLESPLRFEHLAAELAPDLITAPATQSRGVLITNFATVNCNAGAGPGAAPGRLYCLLAGIGGADIERLDRVVADALSRCRSQSVPA